VLPALLRLARRGADLVILVKPQFEAARRDVDAGGGVITDPEVWRAALERVLNACEASGAAIMGLMTSPLRGADGNVEFLLHLRKPELGRSSYTELSADSIDLTSFLTSTEDHS
jgi:23S rRNA (cytidine1920-2'-O)/16S rRNA (cytidine1409-2'-O)-methyltransferase